MHHRSRPTRRWYCCDRYRPLEENGRGLTSANGLDKIIQFRTRTRSRPSRFDSTCWASGTQPRFIQFSRSQLENENTRFTHGVETFFFGSSVNFIRASLRGQAASSENTIGPLLS